MKNRIKTGSPALLSIILFAFTATTAQAEEIDFSCMSYKVWGKGHLSDRFKEYDVVLQNRCPGSVYWAMCIERVDPWSNEIVETHNPTGYVEAEKKARVNLQLKRNPSDTKFRNRFQEFYVNFGYAIDMPVSAACHAHRCEAEKRGLRAQVRTNEAAWERAEKSLAAQIAQECTDNGWDKSSLQDCKARVRETRQVEMDSFPMKDRQLRDQMAAIDPEHCQVWSGELTGK